MTSDEGIRLPAISVTAGTDIEATSVDDGLQQAISAGCSVLLEDCLGNVRLGVPR